jgi:hypothetical protein
LPAAIAACVAANGVPLREPLKPMPPALDHAITLPSLSVIGDDGVVERRLNVREAVVDHPLLAALLERLLLLGRRGLPAFRRGSGVLRLFPWP